MQKSSKNKVSLWAFLPLTAPSLLLFIFAFLQDPIEWRFVALGVVLLIVNAFVMKWVHKMLTSDDDELKETQDGEEEG